MMEQDQKTKRWIIFFSAVFGLLLFSISVYRAAYYPVTFDEVSSIEIAGGNKVLEETANNHLLNTWFLRQEVRVFGTGNLFYLRLHSLFAHILWLVFGTLLLFRLRNAVFILAGFIFLNADPYLNDFFFLARGYGLSLGFVMLACWALAAAMDAKTNTKNILFLLLSVTAGGLASTSNLTFIPMHAGILLATGTIWLSRWRGQWKNSRPWLLLLLLFLPQTFWIMRLKIFSDLLATRNELYFGGRVGFMHDTIEKSITSAYYDPQYTYLPEGLKLALKAGILLLLLLVLAGALRDVISKRFTYTHVLLLVFAVYYLLIFGLHYFAGVLYPYYRGALPVHLSLLLPLVFGLHSLFSGQNKNRRVLQWSLVLLPAFFLLGNFIDKFDLLYCREWACDKHNLDVMQKLTDESKKRGETGGIRLDCSWLNYPSMSFHSWEHFRGDFEPIPPEVQEHFTDTSFRYLYLQPTDKLPENHGPVDTVARYDDIGAILLRRK
ncbi:MAG: Uncharacterized protein FD123_202 [Bacteroidetes bacterium]|nr:MAG: Uncharacterized protein FD123_202 [Bacteroidota bacterium]